MKKTFTRFWSDTTVFVRKQYQARPILFQAIAVLIALALFGWIATSLIGSMFPKISPADQAPMPILLPTTTADPLRQAQATPQFTPSPTATPIPSNLWVVNQLLGKQTIKGYTALVVEFRNLSTGELHNGQCQEPRDPAPAVGDIFVAEVAGDHILLSPTIAGTSQVDVDSEVQTFMLLR